MCVCVRMFGGVAELARSDLQEVHLSRILLSVVVVCLWGGWVKDDDGGVNPDCAPHCFNELHTLTRNIHPKQHI